jgi:hypothetical protein
MCSNGNPKVAGGIGEALLGEEIKAQIKPVPFLTDHVTSRYLAVLKGDFVRE